MYDYNMHLSHLNCRYSNIYMVAHPDFRYDWQHATVLGGEHTLLMLLLILILQIWTVNHLLASYIRISNTYINYLLYIYAHIYAHIYTYVFSI